MTKGKSKELLKLHGTKEEMQGLVGANPSDPVEDFEKRLAAEKELAGKYLDLSGVVFVSIGPDQKVRMINRHGSEFLNLPEHEIIGKNWFDSFVPASQREVLKALFDSLMRGEIEPEERFENTILLPDGSERSVLWRTTVLRDDNGRITSTLSAGMDMTVHRKALAELGDYKANLEMIVRNKTEQLLATNELLRDEIAERKKAEFELKKLGAVIEQAGNIIFITGENGKIEYVNRAFETATGYSRDEIAGKTPCLLVSGAQNCPDNEKLWDTMVASGGWQGTLKMFRKDKSGFWTKGVISPAVDDEGRPTHYFSVFEDITEKKETSEKIVYLTHYDPVTGLLNRSRFIELLSARLGAEVAKGALLLLDIDHFKFISDSFGHGMGDEFLRRAASLLQLSTRYFASRFRKNGRGEILLSRLSGDEFAVFLPGACRIEAVEVAEHVRKSFEGFYQPDMHCHMTVSIGMALYPEHANSTTDVLTKADAAMYRAKEKGRNRFHLYSPEEREIEQMHMRLKWKDRILSAIREDRFEPWYQPIMDLSGNRVTHFEALARMRETDGSIVLPGPFIDIAERFGLVGAISRAVFTKAFDAQFALQHAKHPVKLCLNVSGKELGDREFLYFLRSAIFERGLDTANIVFEITETASIHDLDKAMSFIATLKQMGCQFSLDDFGIGFTSFLYLREMEVDYIKIAGSFIKSLDKNLNDQLFVKAITEVARGMEIKTVAEFVETEEIMGHLRKYGVDYAQGYLIGRPSPGLRPANDEPFLANG